MIEMLKLPFMLQALAGCLLLAVTLSYFGIHVVLRRIVFVDLALAQVSSIGVAVAMLVEGNVTLYALAFTLLGAAVFSIRIKERRIPQEAAIGFVYAVASAVAILLISKSPHGEADVLKILFGNILAVNKKQLLEMAFVFGGVGILHFLLHKKIFAISQAEAHHEFSARHLLLWDLLFYLTLGLVIAFAIRSAGVLLVFSFLIAPGIFAIGLGARSLGALYALAAGLGVINSFTGLYLSYRYDLPTGAALIATFGAFIVLAGAVRLVFLRRNKTENEVQPEG